jgi:hypothetical protein
LWERIVSCPNLIGCLQNRPERVFTVRMRRGGPADVMGSTHEDG